MEISVGEIQEMAMENWLLRRALVRAEAEISQLRAGIVRREEAEREQRQGES